MDVTQGLQREYQYYLVNPDTWEDVRRVDAITGGTIVRDLDDDQLGKATFEADADAGLDDQYLRVYQRVRQRGNVERFCIGTYLVLCPDEHFDGTRGTVAAQGYTPLKELADDGPLVGYSMQGDAAKQAAAAMRNHMRAQVVAPAASANLEGAFVAGDGETWLAYTKAMAACADMRQMVDERGCAYLEPIRDAAAMQPVWTFRDDDSSVILPELDHRSGLRDVPNVVRVTYSGEDGCLVGEAVNDDPASPASTVSRGRIVSRTITSPDLPENPTQADVDVYAKNKLRELSCVEKMVTFWHAYIPEVTVGRAVALYYTKADKRIKALVKAQGFELDEACTVECQATYTEQVWRG